MKKKETAQKKMEGVLVASVVFQTLLYAYVLIFFGLNLWPKNITLPNNFMLITFIVFLLVGLMDIILTAVG